MNFPISLRDKKHSEQKKEFFDHVANQHVNPGPFKRYYNQRLQKLVHFNIPKGLKVLELGCGLGDLLSKMQPSLGVGIDFSKKTIDMARKRHPELNFILADIQTLKLDEKFDFIILSNLIGDLVDVQRTLSLIKDVSHKDTRIIITNFNYLWGPLVKVAEQFGLKPRQREQNWIEMTDLENLLALSDIETIKRSRDMLFPFKIPMLSDLVNNYLGAVPFVSRFGINEIVVARPLFHRFNAFKESKKPMSETNSNSLKQYKVSVIVACKDERGNIEEIVKTVPKMGLGTELIFVDGHSKDGTVEEIKRCIAIAKDLNPNLDDVRVMVQPGTGKGDAVRVGFEDAQGDVLMILDADITVRSEDLPKFYEALISGKGEFINGTRLVYPMEDQAMRFLNMLGNHFFGWVFTWLLDQRLTDTLCGTKVLFKKDYEKIKKGRSFFGDFDPFGDFDLLFGAAKQNMKICEVPIRYRNREYGDIKIDRFKHGLLLVKMSALAFKRFKLFKGEDR